jgi:hypothetical protein
VLTAIKMVETQDEGGKIGTTRVRESCCTVARVYSSYESNAARLRSAPYNAQLTRSGARICTIALCRECNSTLAKRRCVALFARP